MGTFFFVNHIHLFPFFREVAIGCAFLAVVATLLAVSIKAKRVARRGQGAGGGNAYDWHKTNRPRRRPAVR